MQEDRLTGLQQRQAEQSVLKAAASRGQALSGGTALREVLAKMGGGQELARQRRAEAAGWLGSGQAGSDVANELSQQNFANAMSRVQQMNQARGASFAGQQQNLAQQLGARQQDVGNIQSLLGLQPVAAQGGYMAGMQQGASPFTMPQTSRGIGLDAGAGQAGAQFAGNVFGTQAGMWGVERVQPSKAERVISSMSKMGESAAAIAAAACHVAREIYGSENPKWVEFFVWKETEGPRWFKALYNEYSEQWAEFIKGKPRLKGIIKRWMDSKIKG